MQNTVYYAKEHERNWTSHKLANITGSVNTGNCKVLHRKIESHATFLRGSDKKVVSLAELNLV